MDKWHMWLSMKGKNNMGLKYEYPGNYVISRIITYGQELEDICDNISNNARDVLMATLTAYDANSGRRKYKLAEIMVEDNNLIVLLTTVEGSQRSRKISMEGHVYENQ